VFETAIPFILKEKEEVFWSMAAKVKEVSADYSRVSLERDMSTTLSALMLSMVFSTQTPL